MKIKFSDDSQLTKSRLGDLMEITSMKRVHQSQWKKNGVLFLRARDLVLFKNNKLSQDPIYISEELYREYTSISGKIEENHILITGVGTIGIPYLVKEDDKFYCKDGNIVWLKNKNIYGKYLYNYFQSEKFKLFILENAGIGTVATFTIDTAKKIELEIPTFQIQKKIGDLLSQIDNYISTSNLKLLGGC